MQNDILLESVLEAVVKEYVYLQTSSNPWFPHYSSKRFWALSHRSNCWKASHRFDYQRPRCFGPSPPAQTEAILQNFKLWWHWNLTNWIGLFNGNQHLVYVCACLCVSHGQKDFRTAWTTSTSWRDNWSYWSHHADLSVSRTAKLIIVDTMGRIYYWLVHIRHSMPSLWRYCYSCVGPKKDGCTYVRRNLALALS